MKAGDVLLFVDAIMHGSARRVSDGQRRICVYRYGPSWGRMRHGSAPSQALLDRLTPQRRQIVQPQELLPRAPQVKPAAPRRGDYFSGRRRIFTAVDSGGIFAVLACHISMSLSALAGVGRASTSSPNATSEMTLPLSSAA